MAGVVPRYERGPVTYEVVEAVVGGQLVEARTGSKVGVAAASSLKVLGVATKDARPVTDPSGTTAYGAPVIDVSMPTQYVAVASSGIFPVTYSAAATFGDALVATANGQVGPAGATPDARMVVGRCVEPAGVAAGAVGLANIRV